MGTKIYYKKEYDEGREEIVRKISEVFSFCNKHLLDDSAIKLLVNFVVGNKGTYKIVKKGGKSYLVFEVRIKD